MKGEKTAPLYNMDIAPDDLIKQLLASSIEKVMLPSDYYQLAELPKLGSGKKGYIQAKAWVLRQEE